MEFGHVVQVKRKTSTLVEGIEVAGAATEVYARVDALISPSSTAAPRFGFGQMEREDDLIFLAANDENGQPHVIRVDDILIDITFGSDDLNDAWVAIAPGNRFENPTTFGRGTPERHHIEVKVARTNVQTHVL